jgi:acetolactate synthase-1/2/3 large subunit
MGLGAYPSMDKQFIGMLGMHGTYEANHSMHDSDLIIAIGARFDDRVTGNIEKFCPYAKIIHIDIDPASISKNVKVDVPIVGDVKNVIVDLLEELRTRTERTDPAALATWWKQIEEWRSVDCMKYTQDPQKAIRAQYVIEKLWEVTGGDAYITSDVGQHQMWAAQYYKFNKPNRWINSGGLGTMGFGLPAAMGVQLAFPEETVACITGDGSIQMCIQELATCLQYRLPVKIICLNNGYLGMVRQWQEFFYQKRYAMSYMDSLPDFVKLTEAYGHVGMRIENPADVEGALKEAMAMKDRLVFMDFVTEQENNVFPMVPAGAGHNEMILV